MTNLEILQHVNQFINQVNFFHSVVIDTYDRTKLDRIFLIKGKLNYIARLKTDRYPLHILLIQNDLKAVLPYRNFPEFYEYNQKLGSILNCCQENLKKERTVVKA